MFWWKHSITHWQPRVGARERIFKRSHGHFIQFGEEWEGTRPLWSSRPLHVWLVSYRGRRKQQTRERWKRWLPHLPEAWTNCSLTISPAGQRGVVPCLAVSAASVESSCCQCTTSGSLERTLIGRRLTRSRSTRKADLFHCIGSFHGIVVIHQDVKLPSKSSILSSTSLCLTKTNVAIIAEPHHCCFFCLSILFRSFRSPFFAFV